MRSANTREGWLLATVLTATFIGQFDFFVVNVAAPDIQDDLSATNAQLEMVVAGYAFMYAAGLVTGGRLGDILGRRRVFAWGLVAFAVTSALCGVAPTPLVLIAARALQGLSAAVLLPQVLAFINTEIPGQRRGQAMGWFGVASGIGSIAGQGIGGLLVQANLWGLGWRLIFLVNIPIMALALVATLLVIPSTPPRSGGVDVVGAIMFFLGMAGLMGAVLLVQHGMIVAAIAAGIVGIVILVVALRQQMGRARDGRTVMVDPALFRVRSMSWGGSASAAFMGYFASFMFVLTVVLQGYSRLTPLQAGLVFVPSGATFMISSLAASRWMQRHLRSGLLIGCAITATGLTIALISTLANLSPNVLWWWLLVAVCFTGFGNGMALPTVIGLSLSEVERHQAGMASGIVTTLSQFGASLGVAAVGAVFYAVAGAASMPRGMSIAVVCQLILLGIVALASVLATGHRRAPGAAGAPEATDPKP